MTPTVDDQAGPPARSARIRPNLTTGPITKTLLIFALPVLGGNALQSLNGSVNQFWVSHTLGIAAITAIGNANIVMFLMLGAVFGVAMAANILIGQAVGAGEAHMVKRVMGTSITFFLALSLIVSVAGVYAAPHILSLMGTPMEARPLAEIYLRIVFLAMPFMFFFAFLQMAQRGVGDSRTPFYFMIVAVVLDMILNPLLIRGIGPFPRLGIAGSATSTFIGQGTSLVGLVITLYRRKSPLALHWRDFGLLVPNGEILKSLLLRGLPMGVQMTVMGGVGMVMIGFVNGYGSVTAAAYTAASQVWSYLQMPAMALAAAVSSMAAQNVGARLWHRVDRIALSGALSGLVATGLIATLIYSLGDLTLHIFLPAGSPAMPVALHINHLVLWSFTLSSVSFAISGVVRATGAVWAPLAIMVISMYVIAIPFVMLMSPHFGANAIWMSFPLGAVITMALNIAYYRWGKWRSIHMLGGLQPGDAVLDAAEADANEAGMGAAAMVKV